MEEQITPIDLEALAQYLNSDHAPDDCMGLSYLDGFLTGIIIGPETIPQSEWAPVIWGGEAPEFESESETWTVLGTIMGRYNEIVIGFKSDPEKFEPVFWTNPSGEVIVGDWAAGFIDAVEMSRMAWEPLFSHQRAKVLLEPLAILGADKEFDAERDPGDRWKEFYGSKPEVIATCVVGIYNFWRDYQERRKPRPRRDRRPR